MRLTTTLAAFAATAALTFTVTPADAADCTELGCVPPPCSTELHTECPTAPLPTTVGTPAVTEGPTSTEPPTPSQPAPPRCAVPGATETVPCVTERVKKAKRHRMRLHRSGR